ncbi:STAS domain-containing protein [Neobacillus sp. PS3-34]|uniref:STAS domain-containing protein n=1 Tax=Neobacillus sp. PS3-34 TaxID=3070678 RepID=UPI0027E1356B|nr:STAS domain-containing protein [Neobacillus sp. PS3-34]WML48764.1 STAS domain-containing protein [Neobacillus sp. PS3-34]
MTAVTTFVDYLNNNANQLSNDIVDEIISKFDVQISKAETNQAKSMYVEFLGFLAESITCTEGSVPESLVAWSKENGERAAAMQGKVSNILVRYPDTRIVFADYMMKIGLDYKLTTEEIVLIIKRVNHMLDLSLNETVFAFERHTDQIIKSAQDEIIELASPVVPIHEGLAVLPLIGSIDSLRAEHLLNKVVPQIPSYQVECLIIDFSGIVNIDMEVARHIFMIYDVLLLLGIKVVFTGIRPKLAKNVINSGINFSSFQVYANVKQAIESI